MTRATTLSVALASCLAASLAACGDAAPTDDSELPPPEGDDGFQLRFDTVAPPGTEVWKCQISAIPTTGFFPVNFAESRQSEGIHHMDILALALTGVDFEPGVYDCKDLYATHAELMEDGIFLYASQSPEQTIKLPEGVVASLPQAITVMHEIHYVNTTDQPVNVFSAVNVYRYRGQQTETIWGGAVRDTALAIPPGGDHEEWTRCVMNDDIDLLFLASHTHELGLEVSVRLLDAEGQTSDVIYTNTNWESPELLSFVEAPLHIKAGTGFEFTCKFRNPRQDMVTWGFDAEDEMCQIALVYTPGVSTRVCVPVDSSDGRHEEPIPEG